MTPVSHPCCLLLVPIYPAFVRYTSHPWDTRPTSLLLAACSLLHLDLSTFLGQRPTSFAACSLLLAPCLLLADPEVSAARNRAPQADKAKDARSPNEAVRRETRLTELAALATWQGTSLGDGGWPGAHDPRPTLLYISSGNAVVEIYTHILEAATALRIIVCTGRQVNALISPCHPPSLALIRPRSLADLIVYTFTRLRLHSLGERQICHPHLVTLISFFT